MKRVLSFILAILFFPTAWAQVAENPISIESFFPHKKHVSVGEDVYLYWVAKGADACMIHGNSHSTQELPTQGFLPVEVNEDTHFTLTCSGEGRDDQERRILVSVAEGGENEGKESLLRETFDLGHLLNHLVYDGFVQPIVWRVAAWAAPAVLVAYYQHLVGRRAHQH